MASTSQRPNGRDGVVATLDVFIQVLSLAKDTCGIPPAQIALGSAAVLLTMIRVYFPLPCEGRLLTAEYYTQDTMANDQEYIELGRACGDVCQVLHRKLKGKLVNELDQSVLDAIGDLTE